MSKRKKRAKAKPPKAKPPPVIADLFDVLEESSLPLTAPLWGVPPEMPEGASSVTGGEGGGAGEARGVDLLEELIRKSDDPVAACAIAEQEAAIIDHEIAVYDLVVREVLGFPAALVAGLPAPFTLRCELDGASLVFTSARAAYAEAREGGVPAFVMRELVALAHAAQNDRVPPYVLASMLERKRETPELVVESRYAFGGMVIANADPLTCTVGEAFAAMGVELVAVEVSS